MTTDSVANHPALAWFRARPREGYTLVVTDSSARLPGRNSRLGGFPCLPVDQVWPRCPKCHYSLFFVGQIGRDLKHLPFPEGIGLLSLYKCSNLGCDNWCDAYGGAEFFHFYEPAALETLQLPDAEWDGTSVYPPPGIAFERHMPQGDFTVEVERPFSLGIGEHFIDFPGWEESKSWRQMDAPESIFQEYMELYPKAGAKILGHPRWEQGPCYPQCRCGKTMQHLFQLESPHIQLGDLGRMHLFHCGDWCCGPGSLTVVWQC